MTHHMIIGFQVNCRAFYFLESMLFCCIDVGTQIDHSTYTDGM